MGGPATTTGKGGRAGGMVTASSGLNGRRGAVGIQANGAFFQGQSSAMVGIEALRLWRGDSGLGFRPYVRGALGLVELGLSGDQLLVGGLSPRGELGMLWLTEGLQAVSLSTAIEYRPRADELSTSILWLQLGFGGFDYVGASGSKASSDSDR